MRDYKDALKMVENDHYDQASWQRYRRSVEALLPLLEPYRRFKRLNSAHCEGIDKALNYDYTVSKEGIRSVSFKRREHFEEGYIFCWYYTRLKSDDYREPRTENNYSYVRLQVGDLSGEAVYQALKKDCEFDTREASPSVEQVKAFYDELEILRKKHACSEYGLKKLTLRY